MSTFVHSRSFFASWIVLFAVVDIAYGGVTKMYSAVNGQAANDFVDFPSMCRNGRFVAFNSRASNLGFETFQMNEVYLRDLATGAIELVSKTDSGGPADSHSHGASFSSDGRFVAFATSAKNLKPGGGNGYDYDIVVHDRLLGTNELCSIGLLGAAANGKSLGAAISGDARYVAFSSDATNLVPNDTNGMEDVFRFDRVTKTTVQVNVTASGVPAAGFDPNPSYGVQISDDGRYVAFSSRLPLGPEKPAVGANDVWRKDLVTGAIVCASVSTLGATASGAESLSMSMTPDGHQIVFASTGMNLVVLPVKTSPVYDIFVRDVDAGLTSAVSLKNDGTYGNAQCFYGSISSDGRFVAFASGAADFAPPTDSNGGYDVFVRDRVLGTTERIALTPDDQAAAQANFAPAISGDGMTVAFGGSGSDLDPAVSLGSNGLTAAFVRYRDGFRSLGGGIPGGSGIPQLSAAGGVAPGDKGVVRIAAAAANELALVLVATNVSATPFKGGTLSAVPAAVVLGTATDALGSLAMHYAMPPAPIAVGLVYVQVVIHDPSAIEGVAVSNVLCAALP